MCRGVPNEVISILRVDMNYNVDILYEHQQYINITVTRWDGCRESLGGGKFS
jgi:hypothetical protein